MEAYNDDGQLVVVTSDFVLTMSLQTTFCFVLCTIGMLNFKTSRALWCLIIFVIQSAYWGPVYCVDKKKFEQGYRSRVIWVIPAALLTTGFYITAIYFIKR